MFFATGISTNQSLKCVVPRILPTHKISVKPYYQLERQGHYQLAGPKFASLATQADFERFKEHLIAINIHDEIMALKDNAQLEVTVPVTGLLDLEPNSQFQKMAVSFPTVIAINGLGAGTYPQADHVMATDIVGNRYEILVDEKGRITLPEEGTGLFTLISHLTFIYSDAQITRGAGLSLLSTKDCHKNTLYLLPPPRNQIDV